MCLCALLCATTPPPAAAAAQSQSLCSAQQDCAHTAGLLDTGDSEAEEAEEAEEEPQAGAEETATAEVEAEEAEDGNEASPASGSEDANSVAISHLELTARATAALARRLPVASAVAFSFTLSAPANVRVMIVKQTSSAGHKHWDALPDSLTLSLTQGRAARSLKGRNHLYPGRYRLTVKPTGSRSRSIYLDIQA